MIVASQANGFSPESPDLPAEDELEVSVFGKGVGECIVAHVGSGEWIIIDSFNFDQVPVGKIYLDSLGVPPESVKKLIVTHWHNDHICGISELANYYCYSDICLPLALENAAFYELLLRASSPFERMDTSALREFDKMMKSFKSQAERDKRICYVGHAQTLHFGNVEKVSVRTWSPSSASISKCLKVMSADLGKSMQTCTKAMDPNEISIVTSIDDQVTGFLLGGDLEVSKNPNMGWSHILGASVQPILSGVFKVPHHGSDTAYEPRVYQNLLASNPISVLTRYWTGRRPRPDEDDIKTLKSHASEVFCTALPGKPRHSQKQKEVDRMFSGVHKHGQVPSQIRVRTKVRSSKFRVDLFGGATKL